MTEPGNEQHSLLTLLRELTVLRQPVASCALSHGGGRNPILIWLLTLYLHCTCTWKGWKKLAENEEKKAAALELTEAAVHCLVKQEEDSQLAEETKPSSVRCCWHDGNSNSLAKQNHPDYLQLLPPLKVFSSSRGSASGSCAGAVAEDVQALCYCGTQTPRETSPAGCQHKTPGILCAESCRTGGALLTSLKQQHVLLLGFPKLGEFGVFNCLDFCRVRLGLIFFGLRGFNCKLRNYARSSCPLPSLPPPFCFCFLSLNYLVLGTSHAEQGNE